MLLTPSSQSHKSASTPLRLFIRTLQDPLRSIVMPRSIFTCSFFLFSFFFSLCISIWIDTRADFGDVKGLEWVCVRLYFKVGWSTVRHVSDFTCVCGAIQCVIVYNSYWPPIIFFPSQKEKNLCVWRVHIVIIQLSCLYNLYQTCSPIWFIFTHKSIYIIYIYKYSETW